MTEGKDRKLRQVSRLRLVDEVFRSIEEAILSGRMQPGERLVETRIVTELGVSRTTVREALLMLERSGLVVSEPRRGTFVARLAPSSALELKVARALLEGFAVRVGYDRLDSDAIAHLAELIEQMTTCQLPDDLPRLIQIDLAFHRTLIECVDMPRLVELWASLNGQIGALILSGIENWHATTADVVNLHRRLLASVRSHDPVTMQETVIEHYIRDQSGNDATTAAMTGVIAAVAMRYGRASHEWWADTDRAPAQVGRRIDYSADESEGGR